jgi:phage terminase small subunit
MRDGAFAALPAKLQRFVSEYVLNGNDGAKAARAVGYAERSARARAHQLLKERRIQDALAEQRASIAKVAQQEFQLSAQTTLRELARIINADPEKLFHEDGRPKLPREWDPETRAAVASWELRPATDSASGYRLSVRFHSKVAAIDMAMRHFGLYGADNRQTADPVIELLQAIRERGSRHLVKE